MEISLFYTNYRFESVAYRQPRKNNIITEQTIILATDLQQLYTQLARDIEFGKIKIANYINKKRIKGPQF